MMGGGAVGVLTKDHRIWGASVGLEGGGCGGTAGKRKRKKKGGRLKGRVRYPCHIELRTRDGWKLASGGKAFFL